MTTMRDLIDRLNEIESKPSVGDGFFLEIGENIEVETEILEIRDDGSIVLAGDAKIVTILEDLENFERQQLNEFVPLLIAGGVLAGNVLLNLLLDTNAAGEFSDMSLESQAYNLARAKGESDEAARAFVDQIKELGPNSPEAKAVTDQFQSMIEAGAKEIAGKTPDTVADPNAAKDLEQTDIFGSVQDIFAKIKATVQDNLTPEKITQLAKIAKEYALPGITIVALLYGGKKLYDYLTDKAERKAIAEQTDFDKSNGSPYDRGGADAYYGRKFNPHKLVPNPNGPEGSRISAPVTDPAEIAAYEAGWNAEDGRKDYGESVNEAKYQGRTVPLGKPMRGDVKKFKVYVRNPATGNIKKVNFGDKKMRIKKSNPKRRKSFRARHNCANPGPRTKARYWSCRKW